jgi:hypothetical protein
VTRLGPIELAVANALRIAPWRWWTADEVVALARPARRIRRREARHHLDRFVAAGIVERVEELDWLLGERFRWAPDPPFPLAGGGLVPLGVAPTCCHRGHVYGHAGPDGRRQCAECHRDEDLREVANIATSVPVE